MVEMTPVSSSNVAAVGYDIEKKELHVEYLNKSKYKYLEVPQEKYDALLTAPSVGCYLNKKIKNTHAYERIS